MARLQVDRRERTLMQHLDAKGVYALCTYDEGGCTFLLECKRADDFAASIKDGRWREQAARMFETGHKVLFCIEGDLRGLGGMYESMLGAMVNANLRSSICFRTFDVEETACLVCHLMKKFQKCPPPASVSGGLRPPPQSKRQKMSEADSVFARQLMCVPSVSERIAVSLLDHFGNIEELQHALRDINTFPRLQIGNKTFLGKARLAKLAEFFVKSGAV